MSISCLIGEKMFNFAELIEKEFLKVLFETEFKWIFDLIICFNSANVQQFLSMMEKYSYQKPFQLQLFSRGEKSNSQYSIFSDDRNP